MVPKLQIEELTGSGHEKPYRVVAIPLSMWGIAWIF
jgi:hypothetical protein